MEGGAVVKSLFCQRNEVGYMIRRDLGEKDDLKFPALLHFDHGSVLDARLEHILEPVDHLRIRGDKMFCSRLSGAEAHQEKERNPSKKIFHASILVCSDAKESGNYSLMLST